MNWQYAHFTFPLFAATAISAGLALYSWKRRPAVGTTPFALLMLAVAEWSLGYALRLGSADLPTKLFWAKVRYLGIVVVPAAWLAFVLQYTGREKWLTLRNTAVLAIEPLIVLMLVWTNSAHHLIWRDIRLETSGPLLVWVATHGVGFWAHAAYSYLLLLFSTLLLIQALIRSPRLYRLQAGILLIGALMPLVGNVLSTFGLIPFPLDLTPFAFTVAGLLVAWDILCLRLFDIVPAARNAVVDGMNGGVLVLDLQNRVLDINPAAQNVIGRPASDVVGQRIEQVIGTRPDLIERYRDVTEAHTEITLGEGETQRNYELQISPLHDQYGRLSGRVIVLHDTTERKRAEAGLMAQKQLFESLVAMARATAKHPSLEATLQSAVNMAATLTGAEHGSMFLLDGTGVVTHSVLARGEALPEQRQAILKNVMGEGLAGWVVHQRQPALVHDTSRDDRWVALPDTPYVARSALAIPIVSGSAVLGVLTLTHSKPNHFSTEHAYMIQSAADQMTMALRNAQMYDEQRRLAERQTKLYEALRTVGQHLDPETIAHAAVEAVARLTDWPIVTILLPDDTATHLVARAVAGALSVSESQSLPVDQGITGRAFRTAQTQYAPDVSADLDYVNVNPVIHSELAVPLLRGERALGVLDVASDPQRRRCSARQVPGRGHRPGAGQRPALRRDPPIRRRYRG
jgi:PAS domain S-box-containing protein